MTASILHLLGSAQLEEMGPARIVAALARHLDRSKYQVHAWCLGPSGPLVDYLAAEGAVAASVDWSRGIRDPLGACQFWRAVRNHDFAIVVHHFSGRMVRQIIRSASRARVVVHLHARISDADSSRRRPIAVQGADLVVAVSNSVALQVQYPKPVVTYSGVQVGPEPEGPATQKTAVVVGSAGRLVDIKRISDLIKAVALLSSQLPGLRLEIAGDGPERTSLEREVADLKLADRVRFLGWQSEIRTVLRNWDVFVMPSLTEGFPMAALEAMAQGLPVVATNVGGLPELVEDGVTGILIPPENVQALADSLRILAADGNLRRRMGIAAWHRARNNFSIERMVEQTDAIYESLLTSRQ